MKIKAEVTKYFFSTMFNSVFNFVHHGISSFYFNGYVVFLWKDCSGGYWRRKSESIHQYYKLGSVSLQAKIKLISENPDMVNVKKQILSNRGITDIEGYTHLGTRNLYDFKLLGENKLERIYEKIEQAISENRGIYILVDTDPDGYCSAAILYNYIFKDLGYINVDYYLNEGKAHGLNKDNVNYFMGKDKGLIFIPDAGTNDTEYCEVLARKHDVIILDHHEKDKENPFAVIVNPQICDYPNKALCGAAVVYKCLQYLDEKYNERWANQYLDLVAVAMISDVMDLRELESRFLVVRGLMNIENKFLKAIIKKKSFDMSSTVCPNAFDISFYVTPVINACIRMGDEHERDLLFRAIIEDDRGEKFKYMPIKTKNNPNPEETTESFYSYVTRTAISLKSEQDRLCEKEALNIIEYLEQNESKSHNKIVILNETGFKPELLGVLANKLANLLKKPVILLRNDNIDKDLSTFCGSARNCQNSYIHDLRKDVNDSGTVISAAGHGAAFGVEIINSNIPKLIDYFEKKYANVDTSATYFVDYWLDGELPFSLVKNIDEMKALFSSFVEEPYIAIDNILVDVADIKVKISKSGAQNKRFTFVHNNIEFVKFKLPESDKVLNMIDGLLDFEILSFNLVGKAKVNMFCGKATPQFIIDDYEVKVI